ncbi:hypothetical protein Vafri_2603 [Volvox africanus]|uniref:Histone deacetylase n=1 Tax=Volvox africanus TaxID=51714 RepID=A0A8J4APP7_9CHLO|nr:hypothetical protein Vafri_2603 [Volvox africanus]
MFRSRYVTVCPTPRILNLQPVRKSFRRFHPRFFKATFKPIRGMPSDADVKSSPTPGSMTEPASPPSGFASLALLPQGSLSSAYSDVCGGTWPGSIQLPVVYHPSYNISFFGIEKLHPFDSCKYGKVVSALKKQGVLQEGQTVRPREASMEVLADVHTQDYLYKIHHHNFTIVQVEILGAGNGKGW